MNGTEHYHKCRYWFKLQDFTRRAYTALQNLLEDGINTAMTDIIQHDQQYVEDNVIFQQDGASLNFTICQYLNQHFALH